MSNPTEAQTRKQLIDPALERAGWDLTNPDLIREEIPVDGFDPDAWRTLEAELRNLRDQGIPYNISPPAGITDCALYRENGEILAVVEAKRTCVDPRLAVPQAEFYATEVEPGWRYPTRLDPLPDNDWDADVLRVREPAGKRRPSGAGAPQGIHRASIWLLG